MFLNPPESREKKETFNFNSTKCVPQVDEMKEFKEKMCDLIRGIKFRKQRLKPFQKTLKDNTTNIKNVPLYWHNQPTNMGDNN